MDVGLRGSEIFVYRMTLEITRREEFILAVFFCLPAGHIYEVEDTITG